MTAPQKTPISVLNELALKEKLDLSGQYLDVQLPAGEAVRNSPIFMYEYTCNGYIARGEGTAKKRAQHNAAENMLAILKRSPEFGSIFPSENIPLSSPSDMKVEKDAVGPLMDYISEYMLPMPEFQTVREEGPAHDKRFTSRCLIPAFVVEAIDRQKKQAKQQVALQMLTKLKETIEPRVSRTIKTEIPKARENDFEKALEKFPHCLRTFNTNYHPKDLSYPLFDDFTRYQDYHSSVTEALDELAQEETDGPEGELDSLLQKIGLQYSLVPLITADSEDCVVVLNIQFAPDLSVSEMGASYVEASRNAAVKAMDYIKILCSPPAKKKEESQTENVDSVDTLPQESPTSKEFDQSQNVDVVSQESSVNEVSQESSTDNQN